MNDVVVETASGFTTPSFDISGVAPHANVIAYRGCCTLSGLTAAIDQAIADEVDVINYSIGSSSPSQLWDDFDTVGFLNARAAGIFVATSNGNDGPLAGTTGSPADAPWLLSVGASTHNRHNGNVVTDLTSSAGPLADIEGKSVTGGLAPTGIVDAASVDDEFCLDETGHEAEFTGKIVVCVRGGGGGGRVAKSELVRDQGAVGYILVNDELHADSLLGDEYAVPGVFITHDDGMALKAWLATGTGHAGAIQGTIFELDDARGDIMASFSSRGPNRAIDTIVPAVTAPGVDILAGHSHDSYTDDTHGFISGTSMASPHAAGAGALLTQARPGWTPAQLQSALMTTARNTVLNHDGEPATPYAQGSGHIDVGAAAMAGLLFDATLDDYLAANPAEGGDPKTLNLPSFADSQCLGDLLVAARRDRARRRRGTRRRDLGCFHDGGSGPDAWRLARSGRHGLTGRQPHDRRVGHRGRCPGRGDPLRLGHPDSQRQQRADHHDAGRSRSNLRHPAGLGNRRDAA